MPATPETAASFEGVLLGFDVGERRVGVAVGNTVTRVANALTILERTSNEALFGAVRTLLGHWSPVALVVGRPLDDDGGSQPATLEAERFARRLQGRFGLPVVFADERYSSVAAQSWQREYARGMGAARRRRAHLDHDDAVAAALILEQFLAAR